MAELTASRNASGISVQPSFLRARVLIFAFGFSCGIVVTVVLMVARRDLRSEIELRVANYVEPAFSPGELEQIASLAPTDCNAAGIWTMDDRYSYSHMSIVPNPPGHGVEVIVRTGGCLGRVDVVRRGVVSRNIVSLESPIGLYQPVAFQKAFLLNFGGEDMLVPDKYLGSVLTAVSMSDHRRIKRLAFVREKVGE